MGEEGGKTDFSVNDIETQSHSHTFKTFLELWVTQLSTTPKQIQGEQSKVLSQVLVLCDNISD